MTTIQPIQSLRTNLPITGIYNNLTFSKTEVWAWYVLPIPPQEFGVYPEDAGLPAYLNQNLKTLVTQARLKELDFHFLISTPAAGQLPLTLVGIKLGDRDAGEKVTPKSVTTFINLLADAPLDDYISAKDLAYWEKQSTPYNNFFGITLGFQIANTEQLVFATRKKFYPGMSIPPLSYEQASQGAWGEGDLISLAEANINIFPKYLSVTQSVNGQTVTGYRTGIEIIRKEDEILYPEFEAWLPFSTMFPFIVDFSIRFTATAQGNKNVISRLSVEASNLEDLVQRVDNLLVHYQENGMYPVWTSGDQYSLLTESIPSGKNFDEEKRNKKSELITSAIIGNLTFSSQDVYAWVELPLNQFEFLDDDAKMGLVGRMNNALSGLLSSEEKNVECQMLVQGFPFDARDWIKSLNTVQEDNNPNPYNREFLTNMFQYVDESDFRNRKVLLGVNLGRRTNFAPNKSASPTVLETMLNIIPPLVSENVTPQEEEYWFATARPVVNALINNLNATPASAESLAFAIRKNFFPDMPLPTPTDLSIGMDGRWAKKDIAYLADGNIENRPRFLKITQTIDGQELVGYRATLAFSRFPESMYFPQGDPWIHFASLLPFPTDFSLRFTIEPSRKVRKEVGKKLKEIVDQANNMESAGGNRTLEVEEYLRSGEDLELELKRDPSPWVFGRYRITVEATSVEELKDRVKQVIDHYRNIDIDLIWPTGDQLTLFKEGLPNDFIRSKAYHHRHILPIISAGIPTGTGAAGDQYDLKPNGEVRGWIGAYQGYTTGQTQEPWFYDMHSTINTDNSNGVAITGSPGSGKTFYALTLTYQSVLSGAWTIYIDPKADARDMVRLPGLAGAKVLDLRNGNPGILDPFTIGATKAERKNLALETLFLFLGGMNSLTSDQQTQLAQAVDRVTEYRAHPTLNDVVSFLQGNAETRNMGTKIAVLRELPFSQLCFAPPTTETVPLNPEDGLTIFTLLGLSLPNAGEQAEENSQRLGIGIMNLLVEYTSQLMANSDKSHPKTLVIDEAWAIVSTKQGVDLVKKFARMGRAHNVALLMISQNSGDLSKEGISNSIGTRFAFKATEPQEIDDVLTFMNLEHSEGNRDVVRNLRTGECLMRDWSGRVARVQVDSWNREMALAFETNPTAKRGKA